MPYEELEDYLLEITALREAYRDSLKLTRGFEGEYVREDNAYYEKLLSREDCDYLLLGQHFYEKANGKLVNVYALKDTEDYEIYAGNIVEAMRTGYFRYAAHPDLIFLNEFSWDLHCDRACDIILDGAVRYGFALEYNANGFRRGKKQYPDGERYQYPNDRFWEKVRRQASACMWARTVTSPVRFTTKPWRRLTGNWRKWESHSGRTGYDKGEYDQVLSGTASSYQHDRTGGLQSLLLSGVQYHHTFH